MSRRVTAECAPRDRSPVHRGTVLAALGIGTTLLLIGGAQMLRARRDG